MTERILFSIHPRYLITRIAENSSILNDIQDQGGDGFNISEGYPAAYAKPFDQGGKPLNRAELNNVFNLLSQLHFYWQMGGAPLWDRRIAEGEGMYKPLNGYPRNARVHKLIESSLIEFISQVDDNTVEPVLNDPTNSWKRVTLGDDAATKTELNALSGNAKTTDEFLERQIIELSSQPKASKVLNVVSDKTSVIEILKETGHEGETFNSGDVLIVTNTTAKCEYRTAYDYDGTDWRAFNGNVDASKVLISTALDLAGNYKSIGNLDKGSTGATVKNKFPKGTSIQEIITQMIDQTVAPTVKSTPSNSITLRNGSSSGAAAGEFEVGSEFTPYYSISYTDGKFTCAGTDTNAGCAEKSWAVKDTKGTTATSKSGTIYSKFTIGDGTPATPGGEAVGIASYRVSAVTTYGVSNKAKNNKEIETELTIPASSTQSASSTAVTGIRHMFWGIDTGTGTPDSSTIRSLGNQKKPAGGALPTLESSVKTGAKRCIVAIPGTSTLKVTKVTIPASMGADITDQFIGPTTVSVEGANGYPGISYNIWKYQPASIGDGENYDITIG